MSWAKGIKEFCESSELLSSQVNLKFLLVGPEDSGSADSVPLDYLLKYNNKNNFKWLGFRRDVKVLYSISDLAVYPSFYREGGYPRGLTEPMSMGKPVIATESEHCAKSVEHGKTGLLVPIKDSKALSEAIDKIINNSELAKEFGLKSREKAQRELDEDTIITALLNELI
jgi:glycosyltransferase involved in cell wall biosynthesis